MTDRDCRVLLPEWLPRWDTPCKGPWVAPPGGRVGLGHRACAGPPGVCHSVCPQCPSVRRPVVGDAPGACTLVWYLSGGCPWCVHFIYDEYYMANLLSVLNSSWEKLRQGSFSQHRPRVREHSFQPRYSCLMWDLCRRLGIPKKGSGFSDWNVVF